MSRLHRAASLVTENPFLVLELSPSTSPRDIEREGARILALIAAGLDQPRRPRTAEHVREALAELRDPAKRILHEFFFVSGTPPPEMIHELLKDVSLPLPKGLPLKTLLQQIGSSLIPDPKPPEASAADQESFRAVLELTAPTVVPACFDENGKESL